MHNSQKNINEPLNVNLSRLSKNLSTGSKWIIKRLLLITSYFLILTNYRNH